MLRFSLLCGAMLSCLIQSTALATEANAETDTETANAKSGPGDTTSSSTPGAARHGTFKARDNYNPRRAIVNAPILRANEVTDQVTDNELVLGVELNGQTRAYPINMLTGPAREIINDTMGVAHLAATW